MGGAKKELQRYIKQCLSKGYSFKKIEGDLVLRGYPQRVAEGILLSYRHKGELMKGAVVAFIGLLFLISLFLSGSGIAGMMGLGYSREFVQEMDIVMNESSLYSWYPQYIGELMSLSITANVIDGKARAYIENNGKKYLIFDSESSIVTDISSSSLGKEIRHAEKICEESCAIDGFNRSIYNLIFEVESGVLEIGRIYYDIRDSHNILPVPRFVQIPAQKVDLGGALRVNLSSFFNTSEKGITYGYISEGTMLDINISEDIATVVPIKQGSAYLYFTALVNGVKFASNLVSVEIADGEGRDIYVTGNASKEAVSPKPLKIDFRIWLVLLFGAGVMALIIALPARYYDITGLAISIDKIRKESGMTKRIVDYNLMKSTLKRKGIGDEEKTRLLEEMEGTVKELSKNVPRLKSIKDFNSKADEFEKSLSGKGDPAKIYSDMKKSYLKIIESNIRKKDKDEIYKRLNKYYNLLKK